MCVGRVGDSLPQELMVAEALLESIWQSRVHIITCCQCEQDNTVLVPIEVCF